MYMVITCIKVKIKLATLPSKDSERNQILFFIFLYSYKSLVFHNNLVMLFADVAPWLVQTVLEVFSSGTLNMEHFCSHIPVIKVT